MTAAAEGEVATSETTTASPGTHDEVPAGAAAGAGEGAPARDTHPVPPSVQAAASWSWRLLLIGAALAVTLWLVTALQIILVPVAVALLLTVLLSPLAGALQRWLRLPRVAAAALTVVLLVAVVAALLTLAGQSIARGIVELWEQAADGVDHLLAWLSEGPLGLSTESIETYLRELENAAVDSAQQIAAGVLSVGLTLGHVLAGALIALFCTLFFLVDGRRIWSWVVGLLPRSARESAHQAGRRGWVTLGAYTRTQVLVAAVNSVGIGTGAAILQLPLVVPLAVLVFFGAFIPFVGAILTGAVAVLVALVTQGWVSALVMLAIVLVVQQLEGHVLQPFLMGRAVSLHPVAVLLVVTAASYVAGIVGALLAVPVAAVLNTVVLYLHGHDKFPQLGTAGYVPARAHPVLDRAVAAVAEPVPDGRQA